GSLCQHDTPLPVSALPENNVDDGMPGRNMVGQGSSCRLGLRGQPLVDGAAPPDVAEMGVEKAPRRALPELVQRQKELEVDVEPAVGVEGVAVHDNAVQPGAAGGPQLPRPPPRPPP